MSDVLDDAREMGRLSERRRELEAKLEQVKEEQKRVEERLLDGFMTSGVARITVDDKTIYLHRQVWARPTSPTTEKRQIVAALRAAGLGDFVTEYFNYQTLSAYVRELEAEDEPLPEELRDLVRVEEVYSVRVRRSD